MQLLFSIVIPIYNIEKYIKECIESILKQSFSNYEIILVDDGSTDGSGKICDDYARRYQNISVIHCENGGVSKARNKGIDTAKGEYIIFIDGDDFIEHDSLESIHCSVINKKCDVLMIGIKFIDNITGEIINKPCNFDDAAYDTSDIHSSIEYFFSRKKGNLWSACTNIVRRDYLSENNIRFNTEFNFAEDCEFFLQLSKAGGEFSFNCDILYCYRTNRMGSLMNTFDEYKFIDISKAYQKWLEYFNEYDKKNYKIARTVISNAYFYNIIHSKDEKIFNVAQQYLSVLKNVTGIKKRVIYRMFCIIGVDNGMKLVAKILKWKE